VGTCLLVVNDDMLQSCKVTEIRRLKNVEVRTQNLDILGSRDVIGHVTRHMWFFIGGLLKPCV